MKDVPLPQHPDYVAALTRIGFDIVRHVNFETGLTAAVQTRRFGPLKLALISRGPLHEPNAMPGLVRTIPQWTPRGSLLVINAEHRSDTIPLRNAGFGRLVTPSHVAELSLSPNSALHRKLLHQKWRNQLVRAENGPLKVRVLAPKEGACDWFFAAIGRQAKERGYRALPPDFLKALASASKKLVQLHVAEHHGEPVAGVLTATAGARTTYLAGWNGEAGRAQNAHNLLIWSAIKAAIDRGHTTLDFGHVDDAASPTLTHFKRGTGAVVRPLGGTWMASPAIVNKIRALLPRLPRKPAPLDVIIGAGSTRTPSFSAHHPSVRD